jgi:hypothetical protein
LFVLPSLRNWLSTFSGTVKPIGLSFHEFGGNGGKTRYARHTIEDKSVTAKKGAAAPSHKQKKKMACSGKMFVRCC